jgi:hypothetical protein
MPLRRSSALCREAVMRFLLVAGVCACLGFTAEPPAFAAPASAAAAPLVLQFLDAHLSQYRVLTTKRLISGKVRR